MHLEQFHSKPSELYAEKRYDRHMVGLFDMLFQ